MATTAEMLAMSDLSNMLFDAEFYSSRPVWHMNLSFVDVLRPYFSQKTLLRSQSLQSKPWKKACMVLGLLLLECKCGPFYCEINEKIPLHCPHYLIISSLQNRWKQNSKNSNKCLKGLTGNDEIVGLKNWIIKIRFIRNLICHLVLFFHFTESHKWRQNTLLPRIIAQNHVSGASTA